MIKITLPDNSIKEFDNKKINGFDIAESISKSLLREVVAIEVNGNLQDLSEYIIKDSKIKLITKKDKQSLNILRHTTAHVFAQAVLRLYPKARIIIGPSIENGFYYDFDLDDLNEKDLDKIEIEMEKIIKEDFPIQIEYKTKQEALNYFKNNKYKQEIINSIFKSNLFQDSEISLDNNKFKFYKQGEFEDLCRGPHLPRTGLIKAFKLEKITKAYWKGDSKNKQLTRVYGTAFWKKSDMEKYFDMIKEARKRDHRVLGKKLDLFMFHEYSPGSPFFLPKGFKIWKKLQEFIREQYKKYDYKEVMTPNMFNKKLWEISGHWDHYKDDMFILSVENQEYSLKPMNCPSHCLIFKNNFKSYKDLPLRIADFGALHRNELSGALSGLTRVRKFCQDDAHIFCSLEDIEKEIKNLLELIDYIYGKVFQMPYNIELSTRPDNSIGTDEIWKKAESSLAKALKDNNKSFEICEGDGAFYGPKIDFRIKDSLGRIHQTATIQLDFNLPERFDLKYESENNGLVRPVMIHRAILGSVERFMAIIIENFAGKFPLWISPNQIKIINVADRHIDYCNQIKIKLKEYGFEVSTDYSNEGVGKKIALAREKEIPNYTLVLGDKNIKNNSISVRTRKFENGKNEEFEISIDEFIKRLIKERDNKEIYY